jgi:DNA-directed RNA polymerase specialized sigma24 family protein
MTRYPNNPTLFDDLRNASEAVLAPDEEHEPDLGGEHRANKRRWALAHRLAPGDREAMVDGYRAGATARELAERFSISESSVKRMCRQAGAGSV